MGSGSWSTASYWSYCRDTGRSYDTKLRSFTESYSSSSQAFVQRHLDEKLAPKNVIRECCDSEEHPNSIPIILALDVTGSMGDTAIAVQKQLNPIMEDIYANIKDAEIMVMAIGDLVYDNAPIQISQFESDIRIAENLDKIYFEGGGGGNNWESYTAAWYMASRHTKLDCLKRGKKGIIITMGDEPINPYLPKRELTDVTGDKLQDDVKTSDLLTEVREKFDVYHICVEHGYSKQNDCRDSFAKVIGEQNVSISTVDKIHNQILELIKSKVNSTSEISLIIEDKSSNTKKNKDGEIEW